MDIVDGKYQLTQNIAAAGTVNVNLATEGKYVDKNIKIVVQTPAGVLAGQATGITTTDAESILTEVSSQPASGEYITVQAQGSVKATTGGFVDVDTEVDTTAATKYYTIQSATFTVDGASVKSVQKGYVGANETVGTIPNGSQTIAGGGLTAGAGVTALASDGLSDGSAVDATKKIALTTTDAAGYYELEASGSGSVSRAAVTKQVTSAGYFAADASAQTEIAAASESSNTATQKYYVKQSTLSASQITPSTSQQTVTISDGYFHENRTVTIAAMAPGAADSSFDNSGLSTYFNAGTSSDNDVTITPQHEITTAGYLAATSQPVDGTPSYYKIKTTSVTQTASTVSGTSFNGGSASWGTGWITSDSIAHATFANQATSGETYLDISGTGAAPVLVSGDYLYIDAGIIPTNLKISLAKLVPDGTDIKGHGEYILAGHSAIDEDGTVVAGTIQTYGGEYTIS